MNPDWDEPLPGPRHASTNPVVCRFLRADRAGQVGAPLLAPDDCNRCVAGDRPEPQTLDWQRAACLSPFHVQCHRFVLASGAAHGGQSGSRIVPLAGGGPGAVAGVASAAAVAAAAATPPRAEVATAPDATLAVAPGDDAAPVVESPIPSADQPAAVATPPPPREPAPPFDPGKGDGRNRTPRATRIVTPAVAVALALLVGSSAVAISFVSSTGGIKLAGPLSSQAASSSASPRATSTPPAATPVPSPSASTAPAATPTLTPGPTATPAAAPTSSRYALLRPCQSKPNCYLYTVRQGDNLRSIANYFGNPYDQILALNPGITDPTTIHAGEVLVMPPPTR